MDIFEREAMLIGREKLKSLRECRVAVFGCGGVGSYAIEGLARGGIGGLEIFYNDTVSYTNINRQLIALHSTVGKAKVDIMKVRLLDINPYISINTYKLFFNKKTSGGIDFGKFDYVADAIDSVHSKIELIRICHIKNIPIISCMGTGNKLQPRLLQVADIFETSACPMARIIRSELRKSDIQRLKVIYSKEELIKPMFLPSDGTMAVPGSISFVPSVAGMLMAAEIINDLLQRK